MKHNTLQQSVFLVSPKSLDL